MSMLELGLEYSLKCNYDRLTDVSCAEQTVDYILNTDSPYGRDVDFIKDLTKVGQHVSENPNYLSLIKQGSYKTYLFRLYKFNLIGVKAVDKSRLTNKEKMLFKSHFYSHAGDAAKFLSALAGETKTCFWLERWYSCHVNSALLSRNKGHSAHVFSFAGDAAWWLNKYSGEQQWARRSIKCYDKFLDYYNNNEIPPNLKEVISTIKAKKKGLENKILES